MNPPIMGTPSTRAPPDAIRADPAGKRIGIHAMA